MKKNEQLLQVDSDQLPNIFTHMPSLLKPVQQNLQIESNLKLPDIFSFPDTNEFILKAQSQNLNLTSKSKNITACTHTDKKHYAKNMCNNCYHRFGRNKNAWACLHGDRQHYAKGKCQLCYLQDYHRSKVFGKRRKQITIKA